MLMLRERVHHGKIFILVDITLLMMYMMNALKSFTLHMLNMMNTLKSITMRRWSEYRNVHTHNFLEKKGLDTKRLGHLLIPLYVGLHLEIQFLQLSLSVLTIVVDLNPGVVEYVHYTSQPLSQCTSFHGEYAGIISTTLTTGGP